jgi:probable HAF family extracellular repeat protein
MRDDSLFKTMTAMLAAGTLASTGSSVPAAVPCSYTIEYHSYQCVPVFSDLFAVGEGISHAGTVCGWWMDCVGYAHAFLWQPGSEISTIPYPPGIIDMKALDIAPNGQWVAGDMFYSGGDRRAFLRAADGIVLDLGAPPGGETSSARAVSSQGVVIGCWDYVSSFRWERGVMTDLTAILGDGFSEVNDIADNGLITGSTGPISGQAQAFILDGERITFLPLPPVRGANSNLGHAVTDRGNVVGWYKTASGPVHAYAYLHSRPIALTELPTTMWSVAHDLNDDNAIVGHCQTLAVGPRPVMWIDGQIYDINDLISTPNGNIFFATALSISNDGIITGYAYELTYGATVAVRLVPIWPRFADLDCDQAIDGTDLGILLGDWGLCRGASCAADLTADGVVDGHDLAMLLAAWKRR